MQLSQLALASPFVYKFSELKVEFFFIFYKRILNVKEKARGKKIIGKKHFIQSRKHGIKYKPR